MLPVPSSAINYAPYGDSVFVIVHDLKIPADPADPTSKDKVLPLAVRQRFVKLGQTKGDLVAVVSGLKEGDEIVASGTFKLQNSAPVQINNKVLPGQEDEPEPGGELMRMQRRRMQKYGNLEAWIPKRNRKE